jgi:hypothetical protein
MNQTLMEKNYLHEISELSYEAGNNPRFQESALAALLESVMVCHTCSARPKEQGEV